MILFIHKDCAMQYTDQGSANVHSSDKDDAFLCTIFIIGKGLSETVLDVKGESRDWIPRRNYLSLILLITIPKYTT